MIVGMRILIIDDYNDLRESMKRMFGDYGGHDVLEADNGRDGLALGLANTYDLIISDLEMPHLDGWGVIQGLHEAGVTSTTQVCLLTGNSLNTTQMARLQGYNARYLSKGGDVWGEIGKILSDFESK